MNPTYAKSILAQQSVVFGFTGVDGSVGCISKLFPAKQLFTHRLFGKARKSAVKFYKLGKRDFKMRFRSNLLQWLFLVHKAYHKNNKADFRVIDMQLFENEELLSCGFLSEARLRQGLSMSRINGS